MLPHRASRSCILVVLAHSVPFAGVLAHDIPPRAASDPITDTAADDLGPNDLACLLQTNIGMERGSTRTLRDRLQAAHEPRGTQALPVGDAISLASTQHVTIVRAEQEAFDIEKMLLGDGLDAGVFGPVGHAVLRAGRRSGSWRCLLLVACLLIVWVVQYGLPGRWSALSWFASQNSVFRGSIECHARQSCVVVAAATILASTLVAFLRGSLSPETAAEAAPPQCRHQAVQDIFCIGASGPERIIFGAGLVVSAALAVPASSVASRAAVAHVGEVPAEMAFLCAAVGFGCMAGVGLISCSTSTTAHWLMTMAMLGLLAPLVVIMGATQKGLARASALVLYTCWGLHYSIRRYTPDGSSVFQWVGALALLAHILSWPVPTPKEPLSRTESPAAASSVEQ